MSRPHVETDGGPFRIGQILADTFCVQSLVGQGRFSYVYRATDLSSLRDFAIKVPTDVFVQSEFRRKLFIREAEIWTSLDHPNIGRVYDVRDDHSTGYRPTIIMAYYEAGSLAQRLLWRNRLPIGVLLDIGVQISWAMEFAHAKGCIHRDLKAENILLSEALDAVVSDFGLAASKYHQDSIAIGFSPTHMPPEVWVGGASQSAKPEADIYSFGVLAYELFTGVAPFESEGLDSLRHAHLHEVPRSPKTIAPQLSESLSGLILQCLEKDSKKRPTSFEQVGLELAQEFLHATGVPHPEFRSRPTASVTSLTREQQHAHQLMHLSASSFQRGDLDEAIRLNLRSYDAFAATGDAEGQCESIANRAVLLAARGERADAISLLETSAVQFQAQGDSRRAAECYVRWGSIQASIAQYDDALDAYERARVILSKGDSGGIPGHLLLCIASVHGHRGDYPEALQTTESALEAFKRTNDRLGVVQALLNKVAGLGGYGDFDRAEQWARTALEICREMGLHREAAHALSNLALLLLRRGESDEAQKMVARAIDRYGRAGDSHGTAVCTTISARISLIKSQLTDAERYLTRAYELFSAMHDHRGRADVLDCLMNLELRRGNRVKATEYARRAFAEYQISGKVPEHIESVSGFMQVTKEQIDSEPTLRDLIAKTKEEEKVANRAIRERSESEIWFNRGAHFKQQNALNEAATAYSEAIRLNALFGEAYANRANVHDKLGRLKAALSDHNRAIELMESFDSILQ